MTRRRGETTEAYIERWRAEYKKLTPFYCKLINATINFNAEGFNHLIYKNGHRRPLKVIEDRLPYIPHIKSIVLCGPILGKPRIEIMDKYGSKREIVFHTFLNKIYTKNGTISLKVIVKKIGDKGSVTFQSVMKKKITKVPKNAPEGR